MFCPLTTTGAGALVVQKTADEPRLVVDCKVNPVASVGHVKMVFSPEGIKVSCGGLFDLNERLNAVPVPKLPPIVVVPYRVAR